MSPDCDSLFAQGPFPLSPLAAPNHNFYYSATEADFSSLYDFPSQSSLDSASYDMYGGSSDDLSSPAFTKLANSNCGGGSSELLSLEELSNSGLDYDGYLCPGVDNSLSQEWLVEQVSLPSPEEQQSDVKLPLVSSVPPQSLQFSTYQCSSMPVGTSPSVLTPDPSLPASPLSIHSYSSEEEEIKDVLSFFEDADDTGLNVATAVQPFTPDQIMPVMSPPEVIDISTPSSSGRVAVVTLPPSPLDDDSSCDSFSGMLDRRDSSASLPSPSPQEPARGSCGRKRKSLLCPQTSGVKRRLNKASKKERKREQNKTAALRYRQKKKGEKSDIETRRAELEDTNKELKERVNSLSSEINYLKKLWSEVCASRKSTEASKLS